MSSVLPSGWLRMLSSTALTPSAVTTLKTGSGPALDAREILATRTGCPSVTATTRFSMSSAECTRPSTVVR